MSNKDLFQEADQLRSVMQASAVKLDWGYHKELNDFLTKTADAKDLVLTEDMIRQLHLLLCGREDPERAGMYRSSDTDCTDTSYVKPEAKELPRLMDHFMNQMTTSKNLFHPIEYAAICCKRLMELQPFSTDNARIAKMVMNLVLRHDGYALAEIPAEVESQYQSVLEAALRKLNPDIDSFVQLIAECVIAEERRQVHGLL